MRRWLAVTVLLAVAAVCGLLSYDALARRPGGTDRWERAVAVARSAETTKAELPAMRIREQAVQLFLELARSGPPATRSRAAMLAGLLQLRNAAADRTQQRELMIEAAASLRRAVRLDPRNDDAAYDLELLLAQAKAAGRPLPQGGPKRTPKHAKTAATGTPGTGY
jgi:hypothetical protein